MLVGALPVRERRRAPGAEREEIMGRLLPCELRMHGRAMVSVNRRKGEAKETRRNTVEFLSTCVYLGIAPLPGQGAQEICRGRLPLQQQE